MEEQKKLVQRAASVAYRVAVDLDEQAKAAWAAVEKGPSESHSSPSNPPNKRFKIDNRPPK